MYSPFFISNKGDVFRAKYKKKELMLELNLFFKPVEKHDLDAFSSPFPFNVITDFVDNDLKRYNSYARFDQYLESPYDSIIETKLE